MMKRDSSEYLLMVNTGSSSLKATLYDLSGIDAVLSGLRLERIGLSDGRLQVLDATGETTTARALEIPDHRHALELLLQWLDTIGKPVAIGHRVVHGGPDYSAPQLITVDLIVALRRLVPADPEH